MTFLRATRSLPRAALAAALLLAAAPAAFADPPGYDFMDLNRPAPTPAPAQTQGTSNCAAASLAAPVIDLLAS